MNILFDTLKFIAKPFIGKGIIQKLFPGLIPIYENLYAAFRKKIKGNVVTLSNGYKLKGPESGGSSILMSLDVTGSFDPLMTKKLLESLDKQKIFVDIGANIGYFTLLASQKVGMYGEVYAFEPLNLNVQALYENVISNDCRSVHVLNYAIGNSDEDIFVRADMSDTGRSTVAKKAGSSTRTIQQHKLDTLYYKGMLPLANVIKIDVEGYEPEVFAGGKEYFGKCGKDLICFVEIDMYALKHLGTSVKDLLASIKYVGLVPQVILSEYDNTTFDFTPEVLEVYLVKCGIVNVICRPV